jgi:hypothetical protein
VGDHEVFIEIQDRNVAVGGRWWECAGADFKAISGNEATGFIDAEDPVDGNAVLCEQGAGSGPAGAGKVPTDRCEHRAGAVGSDDVNGRKLGHKCDSDGAADVSSLSDEVSRTVGKSASSSDLPKTNCVCRQRRC